MHTHTHAIIASPNLAGVMAEALHPPRYYHICNNINMAAVTQSSPACIIHTIQKRRVWTLWRRYGSCVDCNLEAQSHKEREKYRLFPPPSSHCFPITVINESLFRWEMRFSFPLFHSIHPLPLCNSLSPSSCFASSPTATLHTSIGISVPCRTWSHAEFPNLWSGAPRGGAVKK